MKSPDSKPLIELRDVGMSRDSRVILEHVDARVDTGDFVAVTGPNGGGKTTLLRIVLGLLRPTSGQVMFGMSPRPQVGYLPQKNMIDSHFPITVREVVATGLLGDGNAVEDDRRVDRFIAMVDMQEHARRPIGRLSGGQLQRALLARALVSEPPVLVMDEPLSYLDKRFESRLYEILKELSGRTTILLVSHEMTAIAEMADRHWIVDRRLHECSAAHHFVRTDCDN